jgi:hypothetical protein
MQDPDCIYWLKKYGAFPGLNAPEPLGHIDPRPIQKGENFPDGEDSRGIILWRHPEAIFKYSEPRMQRLIHMVRAGIGINDITPHEYKNVFKNWEIAALNILTAARAREKHRREKGILSDGK